MSATGHCSIGETRRDFIKRLGVAAGAAIVAGESLAGDPANQPRFSLTDVNVSLARWPLRRLPCDEPARLVAKLRARGVRQAWAGTFDGLLQKDLRTANARLAEDCHRHGRGLLLPFGSINPGQPGWEQDLHQCAEDHRMRGVRLHPNYHGYRLDHPDFGRFLKLAVQHRLIVQLALVVEDERMMHPLLRVEPVDPAPLADLVRKTPGLRLVLINALRTLRGEALRRLMLAGNVSVELSMLEGVGGLSNLLEQVPIGRILFGSHAPLFYFEAAELKLRESPLEPRQRRAMAWDNAQRLLT